MERTERQDNGPWEDPEFQTKHHVFSHSLCCTLQLSLTVLLFSFTAKAYTCTCLNIYFLSKMKNKIDDIFWFFFKKREMIYSSKYNWIFLSNIKYTVQISRSLYSCLALSLLSMIYPHGFACMQFTLRNKYS